jgi:ppGpp synthetase/RelA/SpoT-type nucleotidyltranferase
MNVESFHKRLQELHNFAKQEIEKKFSEVGMDLSRLAFTGRIKSLESLTHKIKLKGYQNLSAQVSDGVGFRIVVVTEEEFSAVRAGLTQIFHEIQLQTNDCRLRPVGGYRSLHLVLSLMKGAAPQYLLPMRFELQLRSHIMHSWADTAHMLYKAIFAYPQLKAPDNSELQTIACTLQECEDKLSKIRNRFLTSLISEICISQWALRSLDEIDDDWMQHFFETMTLLLDGVVLENGDKRLTCAIIRELFTHGITNGVLLMNNVLRPVFLSRLRAICLGSTIQLPDLLAVACHRHELAKILSQPSFHFNPHISERWPSAKVEQILSLAHLVIGDDQYL